MSDTIQVEGCVLSAAPIGENDKRLVLLTRELGRISAFARGARRPGNSLMAASNPFVFGTFSLIQGRNSYTLVQASVTRYFTEIAQAQPEVYYGFYFLDFCGYYGREGIDGTQMLNLLFLAVRALLNPSLDNVLVRRIFELRLMAVNGEYAPDTENLSEGAAYTVRYILTSPLEKLFTFTLDPEILRELEETADRHMRRILDRPLKSLDILRQFI